MNLVVASTPICLNRNESEKVLQCLELKKDYEKHLSDDQIKNDEIVFTGVAAFIAGGLLGYFVSQRQK